MNLQQLQRLFRGDRDAEHRVRLVWRRTKEDAEKDMEGVRKVEKSDDASQALVSLRIRAGNKAGFRLEAPMEHKRLKASGYLRLV